MTAATPDNLDATGDQSHQSNPVLELDRVCKRFSSQRRQIEAINDVSLQIHAGRISGLVGPDGAGKTTLLRIAAGLIPPDQGQVRILGNIISTRMQAARCSLGYMPQQFGLYEDLTVQENLDLYADLRGQPPAERRDRYDELMQMTGLAPFTGRLAGQLSGGMKQKLGLACVLVRTPRLLLLDEPTAGVDPVSRRELWEIIQRMAAANTAVLLTTGYLDEIERCHEAFVLHEGRLLDQGQPQELAQQVAGRTYRVSSSDHAPRDLQRPLTARPDVLDAAVDGSGVRIVMHEGVPFDSAEVLSDVQPAEDEPVTPRFEDAFVAMLAATASQDGQQTDDAGTTPPQRSGDDTSLSSKPSRAPSHRHDHNGPIIQVEGLKRRFGNFEAVKGLEFGVSSGEVFGLLGANGAGKSTTFRMLCGLLPPSAGSLQVAGVDMRRAPARARAQIGYMSQTFSLYGNLSVVENLRFFGSAYGLSGKQRRERISRSLHEFQLGAFQNQPSETLPLGYKQRLALAAALIHQPQILFLDEPTSGVDPLARREFWRRIGEQAAQGVTVMVTTHFMEESEYCDRLAIMMAGEILTLGRPAEIKQQAGSREDQEPTIEDAFIGLIESRKQQESEAHVS